MVTKKEFFGEVLGTFLLVFIGCGAVAVAVLYEPIFSGVTVALLWGLAVTLAIFSTMKLSGAHLNPAISIALASEGMFSWKKVPLYALAQVLGSVFASIALYLIFWARIQGFELEHEIDRSSVQGVLTGRVFGEYFPNPGIMLLESKKIGGYFFYALLAEFVGTALLALVIFSLGRVFKDKIPAYLVPVIIGAALSILIIWLSPYSMAGFNPARDFVPRAVSSLLGWKEVAFAYNGFWRCVVVYVIAPICGALIAGRVSRFFKA